MEQRFPVKTSIPNIGQKDARGAHFFLPGVGRDPALVSANGEAGTAGGRLGCFGFFCSLLLRCCPLGIHLSSWMV
jgi:hypothetical protein